MRTSADGLSWLDEGSTINNSEPDEKESACIQKAIYETKEVFWDIGAYHGSYSLRLAKAGKKVVAFEPSLSSFMILRQNVEINHLNISLMNLAIGSATGTIELLDDGASSRIAMSLLVHNRSQAKCDTLDSLILQQNMLPPDFIKIDAEGYEVEILKGAVISLIKYRPKLLIECHDIQVIPDCYLVFNQALVEKILTVLEYEFTEVTRKKLYAWPKDKPVTLYTPVKHPVSPPPQRVS